MKINEHLVEFIRTNLVGEGVEVTSNTPFEKLGLDSFSIIEIILFIERKFGVTLPDQALNKDNLYSVETLAKCVENFQNPVI